MKTGLDRLKMEIEAAKKRHVYAASLTRLIPPLRELPITISFADAEMILKYCAGVALGHVK